MTELFEGPSYEAEFIQSLLSTRKKKLSSWFNLTYRYNDDVLSVNNSEFENYLGHMYPVDLEIMNTTESALLLLLTYICYYRLGGMVNFTFPFTTNEMISIFISQTFRSWVAIFHLYRPIVFLSLSLYDTPGPAPHINVYSEGRATIQ